MWISTRNDTFFHYYFIEDYEDVKSFQRFQERVETTDFLERAATRFPHIEFNITTWFRDEATEEIDYEDSVEESDDAQSLLGITYDDDDKKASSNVAAFSPPPKTYAQVWDDLMFLRDEFFEAQG